MTLGVVYPFLEVVLLLFVNQIGEPPRERGARLDIPGAALIAVWFARRLPGEPLAAPPEAIPVAAGAPHQPRCDVVPPLRRYLYCRVTRWRQFRSTLPISSAARPSSG